MVFTTHYQLKKFKYINQIFFNIIGKENETGNKIPLLYILMTHKSYALYLNIIY